MNRIIKIALCVALLGLLGSVGCEDDVSGGPIVPVPGSDQGLTRRCVWQSAQGQVVSNCAENEACCEAGCTDVLSNAAHCGQCGKTCEGTCVLGVCMKAKCESGHAYCGGDVCIDLAGSGRSGCTTCSMPFVNCDGDWANGCEANLMSDNAHCGGCNQACGAGKRCENGVCEVACDEGLSACRIGDEVTCLDLKTDGDNCGQCGLKCEAQAQCIDGLCVTEVACDEGLKACLVGAELACVDTQNSVAHCGDCQQPCSADDLAHVATMKCEAGSCAIDACDADYDDCNSELSDGCEINLQTDVANCGLCGKTCNGACVNGACCVPNCNSKTCGGDGCGGTCGVCDSYERCDGHQCVPDPKLIGCSDGTREGYIHLETYPLIAACEGAWLVPGIHHNDGPDCDRKSGNNGEIQNGTGCNVEDLCAEGWHVCLGADDVGSRTSYGCGSIMEDIDPSIRRFFLTRTSSRGSHKCAPDTVGEPLNMNDIFGCGNMGFDIRTVPYAWNLCNPIERASHDLCYTLTVGNWNCGTDGWQEASNVVKTSHNTGGGVLCCRDQCVPDTDEGCPATHECKFRVCVPKP